MDLRLKTDIFLYKMYKVFCEPMFLGAILVVFYMDSRHFSFTQTMVLQVAFSITIVLMEVPTGAFADKMSRKTSLVIGISLNIISMLIMVCSYSFWVFMLCEIIWGVGLCFKSGSDTALIYDRLLENKMEKNYARVESSAVAYMGVIGGIMCVFAGFWFEYNPNLPIWITIAWLVLAIFPAVLIKEATVHTRKAEVHNTKEYVKQIKSSIAYVKGHTRVKTIIIFAAFLEFFFAISFWFYPVYMKEVGLPVRYFGFIFAGLNIFYGLSCKISSMYIKKTKGYSLISLAALLSFGYIVSGILRNFIGMLSFAVEQFNRGVSPVAVNKFMNKHIPSDKRATIMSYNSLMKNLSSIVSKLLLGVMIDHMNAFDVRLIFGLVMGIGVLFMYAYLKRNLMENKN